MSGEDAQPTKSRGATVQNEANSAPKHAGSWLRPGLRRGRGSGGRNAQNEPNSGFAGWDGAWGTWDEGANAQNEPNSGGGFRCEVSSVMQSVQNEPNSPPAAQGSAGRLVRNKPNSAQAAGRASTLRK